MKRLQHAYVEYTLDLFKPVFLNLFLASDPFSDKQISIAPYHA